MSLTVASLRAAIGAVRRKLEAEHEALTALDARIGDGDLGVTLLKAFRKLDDVAPGLPDDLGQSFSTCAQAIASVSSSSFGTLLTTAVLSAAKEVQGERTIPWDRVPALLGGAGDAMARRGRSKLGDKTVLDPVAAAAAAAAGLSEPREILSTMRHATRRVLDEFRGMPNRVGRARIFGDRTIGLDDPGMVAFLLMLDGISDRQAEPERSPRP